MSDQTERDIERERGESLFDICMRRGRSDAEFAKAAAIFSLARAVELAGHGNLQGEGALVTLAKAVNYVGGRINVLASMESNR